MRSLRPARLAFVLLVALLAPPTALTAQTVLFVRAGGGGGVTPQAALHVELRVPVAGRVSALGGIGGVTAVMVCDDSFQCDYGGWLAHAGVTAAVINAPRFRAGVSGTGGAFRRSCCVGHRSAVTVSLGTEAAFRLSNRVWFDLAAQHFWIGDAMYRTEVGEYPKIRTFTAGFGLAL
jgi:hypothetical protein